jgi:hypothetical protein
MELIAAGLHDGGHLNAARLELRIGGKALDPHLVHRSVIVIAAVTPAGVQMGR